MWKKLHHLRRDRLFSNTGWMLLSEAIAKVSRLLTVVIMAALLTPLEFGIASLALACHELIRVFSRAGAGARVVQCDANQLPVTAANASLLQWLVCLGLTAAQIAAANYIAQFYNNPALAPLLTLMALTYLCYPIVAVKVFMLQRQNNMQYFGLACAICLSVDNIATIIFLLLDMGVMAVAYAKLLCAAAWVIIFSRVKLMSYAPSFELTVFKALVKLTVHIFIADALRVLRSQADILIAARILPAELFGLYSFAKNAGVGLSQSIVTAYVSGLYPFLCERFRAREVGQARKKAFTYGAVISVLFIVQSIVAPFYVSIFFAEQWQSAAVIVSILCLAGIPAIFTDTYAMLLRATNQTFNEVILIFYCVACLAITIWALQPQNALALASASLLGGAFWCLPLLFSFIQTKFSFGVFLKKVQL